ncbi:hypothetical protein [Streptomyces sp. NBC_01465]|nr:hypothetical protein [Streptomyces sp. NBC_01465]
MDGSDTGEGADGRRSAKSAERPRPVPVLLAGEEEWGDESHIHRGID